MPLRVAEVNGYLHAVNKCADCPFAENLKSDDRAIRIGPFWECGNADADANAGMEVIGVGIPVWCPLPEPGRVELDTEIENLLVEAINAKNILMMVMEDGAPEKLHSSIKAVMDRKGDYQKRRKMRGKHPENIAWDDERPIVFIVEDPGPPGFIAKEITIMPEKIGRPDYTYLRKDDCLLLRRMATKGSGVLRENYWLCEAPTSSTIKITQGADLKKGDRLTVVALARRHNA